VYHQWTSGIAVRHIVNVTLISWHRLGDFWRWYINVVKTQFSLKKLAARIYCSMLFMHCIFWYCFQKEELVEADKNDESVAKGMLSDATQIDRLQIELHDLNRKIDAQSSKLSSGLCS